MYHTTWHRQLSLVILPILLFGMLALAAPAAAATLAHEGTIAGGATSSASVATAAALPAAAGQLYLAAITTKPGSVAVRSVAGLGLTWTLVKAQCAGRNQTRVELWRALGVPSGSTAVSASLSGTAGNAVITVARYSGVDPTAPLGAVVSANTLGTGGACSGGVDGAAYNVSLPASTPGALAFGAVAMRNRTHTPGSGYTERAEKIQGSSGDAAGLAIEDRGVAAAGALPVNGSFTGSVDWAVVAVEIRPGEAGPPPANRPPIAQNGVASTQQGTPVAISLAASDPDNNPLTYRVASQPTSGVLAGTAPALTYTPNLGFTGNDSFTFIANDGQADSNIATVSIVVTSAPPPPPSGAGLWISADQIARLPISGAAWDRMKAAADGDLGTPTLADFNANHDVRTLAVALVYARTGDARYRQKATEAISAAIGKEAGGLVIMMARNLVCYIIAADLIDLKTYDPALDGRFRAWISAARYEQFSDGTLIGEHERRANNHGTMPGASRAAIDVYLGDMQDLARTAQVFRGWVGDRSAYAGFSYTNDLSWQADPTKPVAIDPVGASKDGHSLDGAMPEEMRRGCAIQWPPCKTGYPWEGLQGALVQANILSRQGYDVWNWQDRALLRAVVFLDGIEKQYGGWWATGDDTWVPWFVNYVYGTSYPTTTANIGKNMGWTDWMYGR